MRVIGPNCIGVVDTRSSTYLIFSREIGRGAPRPGSIALVTQSGAVGSAVLIGLLRRGGGLAHWVTSGDEVDAGTLELVAGLLRDPGVRGIGVFFEGITDLAWLPAVREAIAAIGKPVYVLKGATTDAGRLAAAGHTGRVVGSAEAARAVMREAGMTLVPTAAHLTDALIALDVLRGLPGPRVGVLSISGAFGVMAGDAVRQSERLTMAPVADDPALQVLVGGREHEVANPLDVAGSKPAVRARAMPSVASRITTLVNRKSNSSRVSQSSAPCAVCAMRVSYPSDCSQDAAMSHSAGSSSTSSTRRRGPAGAGAAAPAMAVVPATPVVAAGSGAAASGNAGPAGGRRGLSTSTTRAGRTCADRAACATGPPAAAPAASAVSVATPASRGSTRLTAVPTSGGLSMRVVPPNCSVQPRAIDRPRPVPSPGALVVKKGSKAWACTTGLMPQPLSRTVITA